MKTLDQPQRCTVLFERDGVPSAVRWQGRVWSVRAVLDAWTYWGRWWLTPGLVGEARTYWVLATGRGEITVFLRDHPDPEVRGWWVEGWFD